MSWSDVNFKIKILIGLYVWRSPIPYFFSSIALSDSWYMSTSVAVSSACNSFFMLFTHSVLLWNFFCYRISVNVFFFKIVLIPLDPVDGLSSCIFHLLVGWIFFRYFGITGLFELFDLVIIIFKSPLFCHYQLISRFKLHFQTCLLFCFGLFIPRYLRVFFSLALSLFASIFLNLPASIISLTDLVLLFGFLCWRNDLIID